MRYIGEVDVEQVLPPAGFLLQVDSDRSEWCHGRAIGRGVLSSVPTWQVFPLLILGAVGLWEDPPGEESYCMC